LVLGLVLEQVTGRPISDLFESRPRRCGSGADRPAARFRRKPHGGAAGIVTNVRDLAINVTDLWTDPARFDSVTELVVRLATTAEFEMPARADRGPCTSPTEKPC